MVGFCAGRMFNTILYLSLCLVSVAFGSGINSNPAVSQNGNCSQLNFKNNPYTMTKTCIRDYIKYTIDNSVNRTCTNINDVRNSYLWRISSLSACGGNKGIKPYNVSTQLRLDLIENILDVKMKDFIKANGTECIKSIGPDIVKCVEKVINERNKTNLYLKMHASLAKFDYFELEEKTIVESILIFNCTYKVIQASTSCNKETLTFVNSLGHFILQTFSKEKYQTTNPSPPVKARTATIIIVIVVVIVIIIVAVIIIKKTVCRKRRRSEQANYQGSVIYKANAQDNTKF